MANLFNSVGLNSRVVDLQAKKKKIKVKIDFLFSES